MNHVNTDKLKELMKAIKQDSANAKIVPKVRGKWIFEEDQPQFRSDIEVASSGLKPIVRLQIEVDN